MRRLLDYNPVDGIKEWFTYKDDGSWVIDYEFDDISHEVEASKQLQNDPDYWKKGVKNEFAHYAHIPNSLLFSWMREGVDINDPKALLEKVNSREYRYLKCTEKIVLP